MKKYISVSGTKRNLEGFVEIKISARKETRLVHNPSTHDDDNRTFVYHHIDAYMQGKCLKHEETQNELAIPHIAKEVENWLYNELRQLADIEPQKSVQDQLTEMGYMKL